MHSVTRAWALLLAWRHLWTFPYNTSNFKKERANAISWSRSFKLGDTNLVEFFCLFTPGLANLSGKCTKFKKKVCKCAKNVFFQIVYQYLALWYFYREMVTDILHIQECWLCNLKSQTVQHNARVHQLGQHWSMAYYTISKFLGLKATVEFPES